MKSIFPNSLLSFKLHISHTNVVKSLQDIKWNWLLALKQLDQYCTDEMYPSFMYLDYLSSYKCFYKLKLYYLLTAYL